MRKMILKMASIGVLLAAGWVDAKPLNVEWLLRGGLSWKGQLYGRDGDFVQLKRPEDSKAVGVGANTIKKLIFDVKLDLDKVTKMVRTREYDQARYKLEKALKPFAPYSDIPSNLTPYNTLLMEVYFRTQQYDKTLEIASGFAKKSKDPVLKEKSRVYQALSLINSDKLDEAQQLFAKYGWDKEVASNKASSEKLYISAKLLALKHEYSEAMMSVAKVIAFHSQDVDWMPPAELLCAEIYTDMELYDSAAEVCRQIELLYKNSEEFDQAVKLKIKIEALRAEKKLKESSESTEV